ncbi:unnamed protein product [Staurois parvus]|uniref:Uncharacterized protein n=1 Tax=Staurois parvus TaxID=386267 RepID=A0ABN9BHQ1_9NEOB|nr:unnamed protein product [Staurois parvus]
MISVAPVAPPVQRHLSTCPSVPALCSSMPPASAHQCHISVPI